MDVDKALGGGADRWLVGPWDLLGQELDNYWNSTSILVSHSQYWQSDRGQAHCSVQGRCWPPLSVFITNYQLINSALSLFRKYPEKLSSNIDPAPLAVASGQSASHPPPLIRISAVCEAIILIWDKVGRKWQTLSTLLDIFFLLFL